MRAMIIPMTIVTMILAGCDDPKFPAYATDQNMRQKLFQECLKGLPAGPKSTQYNDWDEVVGACDDAALWQSRYCYENCPPSREEASLGKVNAHP